MKKLLLAVALVCMVFVGCSEGDQQDLKSLAQSLVESDEVRTIKALETDQGILLGDLVEAGMGSPTFEMHEGDDGETYVTISGRMTYDGVEMVATLQYKRVGEDAYEFYTLVYNDLPVNSLETIQFFNYLNESYEASLEVTDQPLEDEDVAVEVGVEEASDEISLDDLFTLTYADIVNTPQEYAYTEYSYEGAHLVDFGGYTYAFDLMYSKMEMPLLQIFVRDENLVLAGISTGMTMTEISTIFNAPYTSFVDEMEGDFIGEISHQGYNYTCYLEHPSEVVKAIIISK